MNRRESTHLERHIEFYCSSSIEGRRFKIFFTALWKHEISLLPNSIVSILKANNYRTHRSESLKWCSTGVVSVYLLLCSTCFCFLCVARICFLDLGTQSCHDKKVGGKALAGTWEAVIQQYQTGFSSDFLEPAATVSSSRLALYYDLNYFSVLKVAAFLRLTFMVVGQHQSPVFCSSVRRATIWKKCLPSPVFAK